MDIRDKTVLVTGGTGFIGRSLCAALTAQGARVVVLTRRPRPPAGGVTYIRTLSDLPQPGPDIIINLAGAPIAQRWTPAARARIRDSRIGTTQDLVAYMQQAEKKPQLFISASAIGYYGTSLDRQFSEADMPADSDLFSARLCADWEATALGAQGHAGRTVLLRLGVVLEKDGGVLKKMLLPFQCGMGGRLGDGRQWFSWIDRDDLIKLVFFIIAQDEIKGPVNATAPHPVRNDAFTKVLGTVLRRPTLLPVPAKVLTLAYGDMADEIMLQGQKVLPTKALQHGFVFDYPDLEMSLKKIIE